MTGRIQIQIKPDQSDHEADRGFCDVTPRQDAVCCANQEISERRPR